MHDPTLATHTPATAGNAGDPILSGLNPEQRDAVTYGEGPLLVVAGAGTGKTQVITRRIAWLIASKRARAEEILALTFTEKAAAEMEARVDVLVPYGYVGATISTFHAFCDRMVRDHALELGLTSPLRVENPTEILVFLRERILDMPLSRYRPLGAPDTHLRALVSVFDRARDEDVSPARYLEFARSLAANAGDDADHRDRAAAELEKAAAYAWYERILPESGRLDFGSQIGLALRLLRERAYLRRELAQRYRYILVDEFQDTNHVQFELVRLIAGERRNLTVVGDDDQSIYRFRGARIENLLEFRDRFGSARTIVLRRNYRSGQRILDLSHRLIRNNDPERLEARAGFDKRLIAERDLDAPVENRSYDTASDEAEAVALEIEELIASGRRTPRDFAVLARAHGSLEPFAMALKNRGVPFRRIGMRGLYTRPEILLCLNLLRSVADPADGASAYMALGDPLFGADPVDLARIGALARRTHRPFLELAAADGASTAATIEAVATFVALHRKLCASAAHRPTSEVLYEFVTDSGLLGRLAADDSPAALEQVGNLNRLFRIVARVGPLLKQDRVPQFIHHLDLLIDMGDDPATTESEAEEDAVHLLTAHNAKGLEFPVVYLVQIVQGRFPLQFRGEMLPFPPELQHGGALDRAAHDREERRLFYVAMTRARDRLVFTHAADYGGTRAAKPGIFVAEALGLTPPAKGGAKASPFESIARYAPVAEPLALATPPLAADQPLEISHQRIDDFLTCPLKYRYAHIAQVPLANDPRVMYGTAIHHAIRIYHQHRLHGMPIVEDDVVQAFTSAWSSEGFYSREHEERRFEQGCDALRRFVHREDASRFSPLAVERDFRFRLGEHDTVTGRWDRIDERSGHGVVLVDYKTSDLEDQDQATERAARSVKDGQLGLYALAYFEMYGVVPGRVELYFIGPGVLGSAGVEPAHLERARERARRAALGIRRAEFPATPERAACSRCPYSRFCPHSAARGAA